MNKTCIIPGFQQENSEDEIDQDIVPLREKAEVHWQYIESNVRWHKQREEHFQERLKNFNETINSNPDKEVTFDFEGDPVLRETVKG